MNSWEEFDMNFNKNMKFYGIKIYFKIFFKINGFYKIIVYLYT